MPLKKPSPEDQRKIHSEINQIVNQRFLITTAAITVLGVVGAWLIPKTAPSSSSPLGGFIFFGSVLLLIILFALFLYSHFLRGMLRTLTSYLIVTKTSQWESAWSEYRKTKYFGYTDAQTTVFIFLGLIASAYPFMLALIYSLSLEPYIGLLIHSIAGFAYLLFVSGIGFCAWWYPEKGSIDKWNKLNSAQGIGGKIMPSRKKTSNIDKHGSETLADIKFAKHIQLTTIYYALLLYFAVILFFKIPGVSPVDHSIAVLFLWLVRLLSAFAFFYQIITAISLWKYRNKAKINYKSQKFLWFCYLLPILAIITITHIITCRIIALSVNIPNHLFLGVL